MKDKFKGACFSRLERGTDIVIGGFEVAQLPNHKRPSLLLLSRPKNGGIAEYTQIASFSSVESAEAFIDEFGKCVNYGIG